MWTMVPHMKRSRTGAHTHPEGAAGAWLLPIPARQEHLSPFSREAGKSGFFYMKFLFLNVDKSLKVRKKKKLLVKQNVPMGQVSPISCQFGTIDSGCWNGKLCSLNTK